MSGITNQVVVVPTKSVEYKDWEAVNEALTKWKKATDRYSKTTKTTLAKISKINNQKNQKHHQKDVNRKTYIELFG